MLAFLFHTALAAEPGLCLIQATVEGGQVELEALLCDPARLPEAEAGVDELQLDAGVHVLELQPHFEPETSLRRRGVEIPHAEVRPKKSLQPAMPAEAKRTGAMGDCVVRLVLDESGRVEALRFDACPVVFRDSVASAAWKSSFHPHEVEGQTTTAQFVYTFRFRFGP